MIHALMALNIFAGLFLIAVVLLQTGKGADMGAAFGGGSATVFGPSGAGNFLTKLTAATAVTFMLTSLLLAVLSAKQVSLFDRTPEPVAEAPAPIAPTPAAEASAAASAGTAAVQPAEQAATQAADSTAAGTKQQASKAAAKTEAPASAPAAP